MPVEYLIPGCYLHFNIIAVMGLLLHIIYYFFFFFGMFLVISIYVNLS